MEQAQATRYPRFSRRVAAVVVDSMIYLVLFVAMAISLGHVEVSGVLKAVFVGLVFFALEPGLVTVTGGTLGQHWRGLRVQSADTGMNLGLLRAILRFAVKSVLGWFSLLLILLTKRHQAVHDMASGSVVVLRNPEAFSSVDALEERELHDHGFAYPSALQRILCILGYQVIWFLVIAVALYFVLSENCLLYDQCSGTDDIANPVISLVWFVGCGAIIVQGWRGKLLGARRTAL